MDGWGGVVHVCVETSNQINTCLFPAPVGMGGIRRFDDPPLDGEKGRVCGHPTGPASLCPLRCFLAERTRLRGSCGMAANLTDRQTDRHRESARGGETTENVQSTWLDVYTHMNLSVWSGTSTHRCTLRPFRCCS
uniref:Uncharacterized protein n=1 Tax=Vitrella brassicaformis TaxID=1169539 RepID=A0A7S1KEA1_9ALVE